MGDEATGRTAYIVAMPILGTLGAPYFYRPNVTKFLRTVNIIFWGAGVKLDKDKLE